MQSSGKICVAVVVCLFAASGLAFSQSHDLGRRTPFAQPSATSLSAKSERLLPTQRQRALERQLESNAEVPIRAEETPSIKSQRWPGYRREPAAESPRTSIDTAVYDDTDYSARRSTYLKYREIRRGAVDDPTNLIDSLERRWRSLDPNSETSADLLAQRYYSPPELDSGASPSKDHWLQFNPDADERTIWRRASEARFQRTWTGRTPSRTPSHEEILDTDSAEGGRAKPDPFQRRWRDWRFGSEADPPFTTPPGYGR